MASTMVIFVLERRGEIGLRGARGAVGRHVCQQFLSESLLLATAGWFWWRSWPVAMPLWASAGGLAATVVVEVIEGLYPVVRAAWLPPTEALTA